MSEVRHATDPVSGQRVEIRNDLVKRLRGQYASGPTMPNGEPEFGWRQFGEPKPIELEAAAEIERLQKELYMRTRSLEEEMKRANRSVQPL